MVWPALRGSPGDRIAVKVPTVAEPVTLQPLVMLVPPELPTVMLIGTTPPPSTLVKAAVPVRVISGAVGVALPEKRKDHRRGGVDGPDEVLCGIRRTGVDRAIFHPQEIIVAADRGGRVGA